MKLLLDTQVIVWLVREPERVPDPVKEMIRTADRGCISVVSAWEYAIKRAKGYVPFEPPFNALLGSAAFERLPLAFNHLAPLAELPPIHRDPFDRMLVAQAIAEELTIVTADAHIPRYPVETLW